MWKERGESSIANLCDRQRWQRSARAGRCRQRWLGFGWKSKLRRLVEAERISGKRTRDRLASLPPPSPSLGYWRGHIRGPVFPENLKSQLLYYVDKGSDHTRFLLIQSPLCANWQSQWPSGGRGRRKGLPRRGCWLGHSRIPRWVKIVEEGE